MTREERDEHIKKLHADGLNDRQISAASGVPVSTIADIRKKFGLTVNRHMPLICQPKVTDAKLVEWIGHGASKEEMAQKSGLALRTIVNRIRAINRLSRSDEPAEPKRTPKGEAAFLSAFRPGFYAPPTHSRMAETSNRAGRIYGLPPVYSTASSIYGA